MKNSLDEKKLIIYFIILWTNETYKQKRIHETQYHFSEAEKLLHFYGSVQKIISLGHNNNSHK